ncbi:isoleucine--tRNA ligase [Methanosphaera sp.]|uniref:isoleucine--tRNA ligase n=1 Tax=Methanosphaera sp. TaxID=2666342 RepID=UPI002E7A2BBF|nr:isoleucine--tRNA ligase [Methanosphaera sp.]MEE1117916.1 isoleucine--tRNA ligase [Methanosphaera sp.]
MPINEVEQGYNKALENKIQRFWQEQNIYDKTSKLRENKPRYSFLDGPPYCSGRIHLGTAWNKTIKDAFLRYKSMSGYSLRRQAGWDTHGLPIEHKVEQLLEIKSKQEIEEKYGIDNFVEKCKEFAIKNKEDMTEQFKSMGIWMDWEDPYVTYDNSYMESCWWTLKKADERDLLVQDKRVITWCPQCETALANAEIEYDEIQDPSIYVKFELVNQEFDVPSYVLIWTTTPWTIPANMAVSVHPEFEYSYIKVSDDEGKQEILLMATGLIDSLFEEDQYEIIKTVTGESLDGLEYLHPLREEVPLQAEFSHRIILGDHVTLEDGTGCVHTAPGHGPEDYEVGVKNGIEVFCPVGENGCYTEEAGKYADCGVKDANPEITHDLYHNGALLKEGTIDHRVGLCWRCKTPIIYIATKQWFIKVTEIKDQMLEQVDAVEWVPSWAGESRFKDWVSNARDWTISRQRYWGIPIPIWTCEECDSKVVVGSKQELKELSGDDTLTGDFVHRPHVDNITIPCECGHDMHRVPDVLDVWIDSGVAGWAALHYPQDPSENFEDWFPYDFITEGHDQTRGWFYSQLGLGVAAFGKAPYKKVLMHGFTLDDKGQKMSKSIGNVVSPEEVIEKYSADTLRFYLLDANKPWDDLKFNWDEVQNSSKLFNILWNVYYFSTTYMSLDNFDPTAHNKEDLTFRQEDLWIRSRVNTLIKSVSEDIESLVFNRATEKITEFVLEDLSRWYVRLIRGRTWVESDDPDKLGAYYTLYYTLKDLIRVLAPIAPHVTEEIYQNLVRGVECDAPESVHMLDWEYDETEIDTDLEENMTHIRDILEASAHARDVARFKLRWPVQNITVVTESDEVKSAIESLEPVLLEQANSKKVTIETELENAIVIAKPNMSILGPKLRGDLGRVKKYFEQDDVDAGIILDEVTQNGEYTIHFDDKDITLVEEEILFEKDVPENLVSCDFEGGSVYVDTEVTPEIYSEAMARELIRRIQDMRKDLDLNVEANIQVIVECSEEFKDAVLPHQDYISNEVRTANLEFDDISSDEGYTKEWKIEEEQLRIFIKE